MKCTFGVLAALTVVAVQGCASKKPSSDEPAPSRNLGGAPSAAYACEEDDECDDGIFCNGAESCRDGVCRRAPAIECDDRIQCTVDVCDEAEQECSFQPPDADGDGHRDAACLNEEGASLGSDCDDSDPLRFPGNSEICDGDDRDEDCNPLTFGTRDADADTFISAECCNEAESGPPHCGDDCDDSKGAVNPNAAELCDFFDNDCDGETDEEVAVELYPDTDHDSHGDDSADSVMTCTGAVGFAAIADDCNDDDPEVFTGQFEICDTKDNNCNGEVDELEEQAPWYTDQDGDGYGDIDSLPIYSCFAVSGRVLSHNDCDDNSGSVNPHATELCDAVDNDCNGLADYKLPGHNNFEDDDADGIADAQCGGDDCNDQDARTGLGQPEVCDRVDNDCDGLIDEQTVQRIWYPDADGDGWGNTFGLALASCEPLENHSSQYGDCNDQSSSLHPGATEECDGVDNDCDGIVDEGASARCSLSEATSACLSGDCAIISCTSGHLDDDGIAANGCEFNVPADYYDTTIPCATNAACDDGDLCNGVETCSASNLCVLGVPINCSTISGLHQGDYEARTTIDLNNLADIAHITGDLIIQSTQLFSLSGLNNLETVGGDLIILNNQRLQSVPASVFTSLRSVGGDITVQGNLQLSLIDLPELRSARSLIVRQNNSLANMNGFGSLASLSANLAIENNASLGTIDGLRALATSGDISITGNSTLSAVSGLISLQAAGSGGIPDASAPCTSSGLTFDANPTLADLSGLSSLTSVSGDLCITAFGGDTVALSELVTVTGSLGFFDFAGDMIVFDSLTSVGQFLGVDDGGQSSNISVVDAPLLSSLGSLSLTGNGNAMQKINLPMVTNLDRVVIQYSAQVNNLNNFQLGGLTTVDQMFVQLSALTPSYSALGFPQLQECTQCEFSLNTPGITFSLGALRDVYERFSLSTQLQDLAAIDLSSLQTVGTNHEGDPPYTAFDVDIATTPLTMNRLVGLCVDSSCPMNFCSSSAMPECEDIKPIPTTPCSCN